MIRRSAFAGLLLLASGALAAPPPPVPPPNGGTGKANNIASTIAISGASPLTITLSGSTGVTFPTSGTMLSSANFSAQIDAVFGTAQGDILYRNASLWTVLAPGTSGFFLETLGAGANPAWAAATGGTGCTVAGGAQFQILVNNGSSGCSSSANGSLQIGALTLGASGTLGTLTLGNATSGTMTISPPTGALGAVTVTIPDLTDTLVNLTGTQTLTNKTLTAPVMTAPVLGTPASGNGSNLTNLPWAAITGTPTTLSGYGITNALTTSLTNTDILVGNGSNNAAPVAVSGDATLANTGALTVTKTSGVAFGTAATQNTGTSGATIPVNNANNTSSGNNTHSGAETFTGTIRVTMRTVTAAGAVTVSGTADYFICVNKTVGAATTVNLPAAPATGLTYLIKDCKGDAAVNNITVTPAAGNIDGSATYVLSNNYQSAALTYNGVSWSIN